MRQANEVLSASDGTCRADKEALSASEGIVWMRRLGSGNCRVAGPRRLGPNAPRAVADSLASSDGSTQKSPERKRGDSAEKSGNLEDSVHMLLTLASCYRFAWCDG